MMFQGNFMNSVLLEKYNQQEAKIVQLTGKTIDELIYYFAAGYTLQPPKKSESLADYVGGKENDKHE